MKHPQSVFEDSAVLSLTKRGEHELHEPGTTLSPSLLEALVLIDGRSTAEQVIKRTDLSPDVLRTCLNELIAKGFIVAAAGPADNSIDPGYFFTPELAHTIPAHEAAQIHARTEADTEFLRRYGYSVNMARKRAAKLPHAEGSRMMVLVIDDDPDICKVLRMCLRLEDIETRTAANREEIVAELRRTPLPDLVLLDVRLPDVNGFDILTKMRKHPVLKDLPVVMLTAEATREAVLRGILGDADGFITKPFQIQPLIKTVKTMLGLRFNTDDWVSRGLNPNK